MRLRAALLKSFLVALALGLGSTPAYSQTATYPETPEGASDWIAAVEADFAAFPKDYAHVSWLNATYIHHDCEAEMGNPTRMAGIANEGAKELRFDDIGAMRARRKLTERFGDAVQKWPEEQNKCEQARW
jgi:peptidyl-dipeptidase A